MGPAVWSPSPRITEYGTFLSAKLLIISTPDTGNSSSRFWTVSRLSWTKILTDYRLSTNKRCDLLLTLRNANCVTEAKQTHPAMSRSSHTGTPILVAFVPRLEAGQG